MCRSSPKYTSTRAQHLPTGPPHQHRDFVRPLYSDHSDPMKFILLPHHFILAASPILKSRTTSLEGVTDRRRWMSCFGDAPEVVADLWMRIDPEKTMPGGAKPEHIMWTLYFVKLYNPEEVNIQNIEGNPVRGEHPKNRYFF